MLWWPWVLMEACDSSDADRTATLCYQHSRCRAHRAAMVKFAPIRLLLECEGAPRAVGEQHGGVLRISAGRHLGWEGA